MRKFISPNFVHMLNPTYNDACFFRPYGEKVWLKGLENSGVLSMNVGDGFPDTPVMVLPARPFYAVDTCVLYLSGALVQAFGARMRMALLRVGAMRSTDASIGFCSAFTPVP